MQEISDNLRKLTNVEERHSRANRRIHPEQNAVSQYPEDCKYRDHFFDADCSGYVALAVATVHGTKKIDLDTGKGTDREQNMLAFAIHALNLVKEVVSGQSKM